MTTVTIVFGVCAGIAATATMDLAAGVSRKLGLAAGAKGQWVGRWYLGLARGHFTHANIALSLSSDTLADRVRDSQSDP
jgi:hypothetical protein